jgi:virulence plasmid B protein
MMFSGERHQAAQRTAEADANFQRTPPAISLPKGGGAIRGIGEKFAANPVTGTGSMTVPIATSPGRSGFGPQLALSYDSGAGNGPFGFGWSLSLPSITRKTEKGLPQYRDAEESDVFILSGAEDLVPALEQANGQWQLPPPQTRTLNGKDYSIQRYRPRIEGLFARIERWARSDGDVHLALNLERQCPDRLWLGRRVADRGPGRSQPRIQLVDLSELRRQRQCHSLQIYCRERR